MLVTIDCLAFAPPYDQLVVDGIKTIETRTWRPMKQILAVGGRVDASGNIVELVPHTLYIASTLASNQTPGLVIGCVELYGVRRMTMNDAAAACIEFNPGAWAWLVRHPRRLAKPFRAGPGALWVQQFEVNSHQLAIAA